MKSIDYYQLMLRQIELLEQRIKKLQDLVDRAAEGSLTCELRGDQYRYIYYFKRGSAWKRRILKESDRALVVELAKKHWNKQKIVQFKRELTAAKAYVDSYDTAPGKIREDSEGFKQLWAQIHALTEYEQWGSEPYEDSRDFYPEQLKHPTGKGDERVRSKSEVLIARALQAHGIQYHYEQVVQVGYKTYRPDFIIRHPKTGVLIIWEHFGMMDDRSYAHNAAEKIRNYMVNGYSQTKNLITTFEDRDHPLDISTIETIINRLLLDDPVMLDQ